MQRVTKPLMFAIFLIVSQFSIEIGKSITKYLSHRESRNGSALYFSFNHSSGECTVGDVTMEASIGRPHFTGICIFGFADAVLLFRCPTNMPCSRGDIWRKMSLWILCLSMTVVVRRSLDNCT